MAEQPESKQFTPKPPPAPGFGRVAASKAITVGPEANAPVLMPEREEGARAEVARPAPPAQLSGSETVRIPHWLERTELFIRVMLRMYIGLAVCYAPWWPMVWDRNPLFAHFPTLAIYASNGAVRGLVSGLGLLNLWIALRDVIRRREG
jgi:hypothetical protein